MEASSVQSRPLQVFSPGSQSGMSSGSYFVSVRSVMEHRFWINRILRKEQRALFGYFICACLSGPQPHAAWAPWDRSHGATGLCASAPGPVASSTRLISPLKQKPIRRHLVWIPRGPVVCRGAFAGPCGHCFHGVPPAFPTHGRVLCRICIDLTVYHISDSISMS
jgi:hypothetical protein